jgi:hypothetical protein
MAVVSIKNKLRRGNLLVGNDPYIPPDFESIATVSVGSGGAANAEFTSIPSTYTHLQIRCIARYGGTAYNNLLGAFNGDTTYTNYRWHYLTGDGSSVAAGSVQSSGAPLSMGLVAGTAQTTGVFAAQIIDILDYKNTNKNTTIRVLNAMDNNGSGEIRLVSGLWMNTAAITSITLTAQGGNNFAQYSHFALYGIKVAS